MKFRSIFSLCIALSFFSAHAMDSRMTREIVIDTNNLLDVSLCRPGLITAADVGASGLTITMPGVYLLSENIPFSPVGAASAITIASDNVQLDLQCFSISQGNAVAGVNGIEVASGHRRIAIRDGSIIGFTGDGILVNDANSSIRCIGVQIEECDQGIALNGTMADPISKVLVSGCELVLNSVGFAGNWVNASSVVNCDSLMSTLIGFELLNSFSNKFIACNAEDTMTTTSESVYGFFVNGGSKNLFKKLCIDGTTSNATFTGDTATGFYIGSDEDELVLKLSHVSNSITTSNAQAFGIQMDYTFTALSDSGLPAFANGATIFSVNWSSDGRYLAIGGNDVGSADHVRVLEFDELNLVQVATFDHGGAADSISSVNWSPDGSFLAIGGSDGSGGNKVRVLAFDGASLTSVANFDHGGNLVSIFSVNWSSDGRYLSIGGDEGTGGFEVRVLEFDGTNLTSVADFNHGLGSIIRSVNWSPDGRYLAIGGIAGTGAFEVRVLEFDGTSLTDIADVAHGSLGILSVNWSPDGRYLAIGGFRSGGENVRVFEFDGTSLTEVADFDLGNALFSVTSVNWSPDGRYLSIGTDLQGVGSGVRVLEFIGTNLIEVADFAHGNTINSVNWYPCGDFLAIGGNGSGGIQVRILSGFQFPQNCIIMQNNVWGVQGPTVSAGVPWVSNGRGLSASSGANLIIKNTAFNNDINYIFVTDVYQQFLVNVASAVPSFIDNLSFPPL